MQSGSAGNIPTSFYECGRRAVLRFHSLPRLAYAKVGFEAFSHKH
jgi:hypothetical protein